MDINISKLKVRTDVGPEGFLKGLALSPLIYIRLAGILFSIIVFGCVSDKGYNSFSGNTPVCLYNGSGACSYSIAIGVLAFLLCILFLIKDVTMVIIDFSEVILVKKIIVIVDIAVSGFWTFMWFVGFCYTTDQFRNNVYYNNLNLAQANCLRATITFSFFSIILWASIIALNILYLIWILKGTDRDTKPSGYSGFQGQEPHDNEEPENLPPAGENVYTPPEY